MHRLPKLCAAAGCLLLSACIDRMPADEFAGGYSVLLHQHKGQAALPRIAQQVQYRLMEKAGGVMTIPPSIPILGWSAEIDFNDVLARTLEGPDFQSAFLTVEKSQGAPNKDLPLITASLDDARWNGDQMFVAVALDYAANGKTLVSNLYIESGAPQFWKLQSGVPPMHFLRDGTRTAMDKIVAKFLADVQAAQSLAGSKPAPAAADAGSG